MKKFKFCWFLCITFTSALSLTAGENFVNCKVSEWTRGWITFTFDCGTIDDKVLHSEYFDQHTSNISCELSTNANPYTYSSYSSYSSYSYNSFKVNKSLTDAMELVFMNCQLAHIPQKFFQQLRTTEKIVLNNSTVESINNGQFADGSSLKVLYMSHNNLIEMPAYLFSHTPNIMAIDFSYNKIHTIDPNTFSGSAKNLTNISLSHNQLKTIDNLLFTDLINLKMLLLSYNLIEAFEVDLSKLTQLGYLHLDNNRIVRLGCNVFSNQISIDVSINQLEDIDLNCDLSFLEATPRPLMLNLQDNNLENLSFPSTRLVSKLHSVYAARNKIRNLFVESGLNNLSILNLASNNIKNFSNFFDHTKSLITLDISFNDIQSISPNLFLKMPLLQHLYLINTNISKIYHGTFSHQRNLILLNLSHNKLKQINFDLFLPYFQYLTELDLNDNNLTELTGWEDTLFPQLRFLAMSNNDFNCSYLAQFLKRFKSPKIYFLPSDTHKNDIQSIHGISCINTEESDPFKKSEIFDDYFNSSTEDEQILQGNSHSGDQNASINNQILIDKVSQYMPSMKSILIVLCFICLAPLVVVLAKNINIFHCFNRFNSFERNSTYLRDNDEHDILYSTTTLNTIATNV